jgi:hypothetical protein
MNEGISAESALTGGLENHMWYNHGCLGSGLLGNWITRMSASAGSGLEID